jgi:heterodisulfide reductase subunit A2
LKQLENENVDNERRIGVYICHCGENIAGTVDVADVAKYAAGLDSVAVARDYTYMCSDPGQNLIKDDIKKFNLNRVVVASCSPRMHEVTFRKTCSEAGLNPYLYEQANIREHCSWVHSDKKVATEKAKDLIRAAVKRVYHHDPLEVREAPVNPNTLVIGGGISGMTAALKIAASGNKVYLVEKEPSIGGHMLQFDKTFPTLDCSACTLTPRMTATGQNPNIELLTLAEVQEVTGYVGNFKVKVIKKARYVDTKKCIGCNLCSALCPVSVPSEHEAGMSTRKAIYILPQSVPNKAVIDAANCNHLKGLAKGKDNVCRLCQTGNPKKNLVGCEANAIDFTQKDEIVEIEVGNIVVATGYDPFDPTKIAHYGYGKYDNVITGLQFERLCSGSGPTGGEILLKNGKKPESVAIIHCVGSRDHNYHEYCSRVCCMYALKDAHLIRQKTDAKVYEMYIDMRCFGEGYEEFYKRLSEEGICFVRGKAAKITDQAQSDEEKGKLVVICENTLLGEVLRVPVDMVILCTALEPRSDAEKLARLLNINRRQDGFFMETHLKLDPVATPTAGVFIVGCCEGPKDITDSVGQGLAGSGEVLALIGKGKVSLEAATAKSDENLCIGCGRCVEVCEYHAPTITAMDGRAVPVCVVNEVLCKGCGACAVTCPTGAMSVKHFTGDEIESMINALLER